MIQRHLGPLVAEWTGIEIERGGIQRSLEEFLERRFTILRVAPEEYSKLLTRDSAEFQGLIDVITVTYTWFFRDPEQLAAIQGLLRETETKGTRPLCIWVPGCATGEDAYSVALLAERLGKPCDVLGTDLNSQALAHARRGTYNAWAVRDVPADLRANFTATGDGRFQIAPRIQRNVKFARHNLLDVPPEAPGGLGWDIILCRNVFIYFLRERVIATINALVRALCPGGHLLIGAGEIVVDPPASIEPSYVAGRIAFRRRRELPDVMKNVTKTARQPARSHALKAQLRPIQAPLPAIAELSSAQRKTDEAEAPLAALLGHGHGLLDKGDLESALDVYRRAVELDPTRPEARLFTGIAHYLSGDLERATHELRAALFLDSEAWLAAFYLASCHETLGHAEDARREYRHAARVGERTRMTASHPLAGWQTDLIELARRRASR